MDQPACFVGGVFFQAEGRSPCDAIRTSKHAHIKWRFNRNVESDIGLCFFFRNRKRTLTKGTSMKDVEEKELRVLPNKREGESTPVDPAGPDCYRNGT